MAKIDSEEVKSILKNETEYFYDLNGQSYSIVQVIPVLEILDQLAAEEEKCPECGEEVGIYTKRCHSCTGTKPDPVLEVLQALLEFEEDGTKSIYDEIYRIKKQREGK